MEDHRKATLEAGRRKLEEFRKRKEAALAAKRHVAIPKSTGTSPPGEVTETHPPHQPLSAAVAMDAAEQQRKTQALEEQVAQLLESVDSLHRSLNDERYNSSQLEDQLRQLAEEQATAKQELDELRDSASRYANAAESASAALMEAEERAQQMQGELEGAQEAFGRLTQYRAKVDELQRELEEAKAMAEQSQAQNLAELKKTEQEAVRRGEEKIVALASQLAERDAAVEALQDELSQQRDVNQRLNQDLMQQQAALAEQTSAAQEAERSRAETLQLSLKAMGQELAAAVELAMSRQADIERLHSELEASAESAGAATLVVEQQNLLEEMETSLAGARAEVETLKKQLDEYENEIMRRSNMEATMKEELDKIRARMASLDEEVMAAVAARDAALSDLESSALVIADAEARAQEALVALEAARQRGGENEEGLRSQVAAAQQQVAELSQELATLMEQAEGLLNDKAMAEATRDEMAAQLDALKQAAGDGAQRAEAMAAEALEALEASQTEAMALRSRLQSLEIDLAAAMQRAVAAEEVVAMEREAWNGQLEAANVLAEGMAGRIAQLEEEQRVNAENQVASPPPEAVVDTQLEVEEGLRGEIAALQAALHEYRTQSQQYAQRIEQLETSAATTSNWAAADAASRLQAALRRAEDAELRATQLQAGVTVVRTQLESEQRRAAQLEAFSQRQHQNAGPTTSSSRLGDKKDEDNAFDPEAAALAGGNAFRPLVGLVRSLPAPLSHPVVVRGARELDKASVALDARPHVRVAVMLYFVLLHVMLLI